MKFIKCSFFLILILLAAGCVSLTYADYRDDESARKAIVDLKEGALIVRFYSQQKSIDEIDRLLKNEISEKIRENLEQKKRNIEEKRKARFQSIYDAIAEKYSFSPVYFINDHAMLEFNSGNKKNVFLNKEMEIDTSIHFDFDNYFYLATYEEARDFTVLHQSGRRIAAPFPSKISAPGSFFGAIIGFFVNKDEFVPVFGKWDETLKIYYNKVAGIQ